MISKLCKSRAVVSFCFVLLVSATVVVGFKLVQPTPEMRSYCALMPDGIGLYQGSAARVEFDLPVDHPVALDAGAVTVSDSLVADRRLAIISSANGDHTWDESRCITRTLTPKSMSETFAAVSRISEQLNGKDQPGSNAPAQGGLQSLSRAVDGTGEQINQIIQGLGSALSSPDAAIGHIAKLLDALSSLVGSAASGWDDIESTVTRLTPLLTDTNDRVLTPIIEIVWKLGDILPTLNDISIKYGGPLTRQLGTNENLPQMIAAGVESLQQIIAKIPSLRTAFAESIDSKSRRPTMNYAAPRIAIPDQYAPTICGPDVCTQSDRGQQEVSVSQLVLGAIGRR